MTIHSKVFHNTIMACKEKSSYPFCFKPCLYRPTQVFPCEICEIFKNTYLEEHLRASASDSRFWKIIMRIFWRLERVNIYSTWHRCSSCSDVISNKSKQNYLSTNVISYLPLKNNYWFPQKYFSLWNHYFTTG